MTNSPNIQQDLEVGDEITVTNKSKGWKHEDHTATVREIRYRGEEIIALLINCGCSRIIGVGAGFLIRSKGS